MEIKHVLTASQQHACQKLLCVYNEVIVSLRCDILDTVFNYFWLLLIGVLFQFLLLLYHCA